MRYLITALVATMFTSVAMADDPASKARSWGLVEEEKAVLTGKVVDLKCELTGQCAPKCGEGQYQLGILTTDGTLFPVLKNGQASFNGAVADLLPHCGKTIQADGLLVGENLKNKFYQIQLIKVEGGEWQKANLHTKEWAKQFPNAKGKGPWFRRDPRVLKELEKDGYLGLGKEADAAFIKEWF